MSVTDPSAITPGIQLSEADKAKLRFLREILCECCAFCDRDTSQIIRLRMRDLPFTILAPLCSDCMPRSEPTDAELVRLEQRLLQGVKAHAGG